MVELMELIVGATNHLLRSIHVVYTLLSLVAFVYLSNVLVEAIDGLRFWRYEDTAARVINAARMSIGILGAVLLLLAWF